jgi:putative Mn2+ efflux pump MntP
MDLITIIAIALGLSFDTFAASLSFGITRSRILFREAVPVGLVMAFFQGGLTVAGYFLGAVISGFLTAANHWIALGLLTLIGARMIINGLQEKEIYAEKDYTKFPELVAIAMGTSIDAAAAGISFAILDIKIWLAGAVIAFVTFMASMTAIRLGKSAGSRTGRKTEIIGGLILIAIGIKIFLEHILGG